MNITLSVDKELVKRAREYAAQHGTNLNQIIREYMKQFSSMSNIEKNAGEFARLAIEQGGASPTGFVFDREEAHTRKGSGT